MGSERHRCGDRGAVGADPAAAGAALQAASGGAGMALGTAALAVGALFYVLIGSERVARRRVALVRSLESRLEAIESTAAGNRKRKARRATAFPELERVNDIPMATGNSVRLLPDGTSFFPVLLKVIRNAQHHLHLVISGIRTGPGTSSGMP